MEQLAKILSVRLISVDETIGPIPICYTRHAVPSLFFSCFEFW